MRIRLSRQGIKGVECLVSMRLLIARSDQSQSESAHEYQGQIQQASKQAGRAEAVRGNRVFAKELE